LITKKELSIAQSAAYCAAYNIADHADAAYFAALSAAHYSACHQSKFLLQSAAYCARESAAYYAVENAESAEREWQVAELDRRLLELMEVTKCKTH